ncbi:MAG TPA: cell envelope integrity protein TolA [Rhodospirillaceae bacterium]|nr:cell envelope integrity protein TolA [Rhodospirillaceae bacterium]
MCSAAFHAAVVLLAVLGLPSLLSPPPEIAEPVIVELAQLGDKTNPPPRQVEAPKPEEKQAEPPKQDTPPAPPKPEPPKPEPPKPEPPKPEPPKPPPPPPPKPAEPEPEPIPVPQPKPKPPEPPKPDVKPPPKKPTPPPDEFDTLLKSVDKLKKTLPPPPSPQPQQAPATSSKTVTSNSNISSEPVSMSDKDYIAAQFRRCWNFDPGAKDAGNLIVRVRVLLNSDGSVVQATRVDDPRYNSDNFFRSASDSAVRAVYTCSPIKLPPGKYDALKELLLNFDPRDSVR